MKKILTTFLALSSLSLAQEATPDPAEKKKPQFILEMEALTKEQKGKYFGLYQKADQLFKQKRIFECLEAIHQLHKIYDNNPASLNLKGACYVEFRNFPKARAAFDKALKSTPDSFNVAFNLAEISFVTNDYSNSLSQLQRLKERINTNKAFQGMESLIDFKILLCMLKTDKKDGAKEILEGTDFLDDSPLFYYGHAALHYDADNGSEAEVWLARADRIFRDPNTIAPWKDTLIEFGYIKSFYGGDLEVPQN